MVGMEEHSRSCFGPRGPPMDVGSRNGHEETGELAGAGQRAREVTVQIGDRGGALLPRSDNIPGT
jgi:hypothetical protein